MTRQWRAEIYFDGQQLLDQTVTHDGSDPASFSVVAEYLGDGRLDARHPGRIQVVVKELDELTTPEEEDNARDREFATLLTRTSAYPQSVVSTIWCASCLLIMRNRGIVLQYDINDKPFATTVNTLYELAIELRRLEQKSGFKWKEFRDGNHPSNTVIYLSPAAIFKGTHVCQAHVYDVVEREVRMSPRF